LIHVLDTNVFIAFLNGKAEVLNRLDLLTPEDVVLCAPVLAELEYGAYCSARQGDNLARIRALAARTRFQAFDSAVARQFGDMKAELRRTGNLKADFDLSIAATSLHLGATLVSDDRAFHDKPIPRLTVANWPLS
jgi:tRNA(fMet)-specific endonuclease VapC